ncbi:IS30 family transposase [Alkalisalibacterium limincola]|uniref:IS30 family transposase n=1 Tax=Alkalisalibacterium limincola TaxID=2699169 RepID=A0A5C8KH69_9GAMM|nr:IS30 family transposase [Alkalisalibacterium limincola]TXK59071.1 IS30 family transposase [Alkalisalibacterium limincola]
MMYHQLTVLERYTISKLRKAGLPVAEMARILGCHRSTIYREYHRNSVQIGRCLTYCPSKAQERRNGRLRRSRRGPHHDQGQYARVVSLLRQQWSPEQIAGTLAQQGEFRISFQTIYRHVRRDWRAGGKLYLELRQRYKRRKRHYGLEKRGRLQGKRMIDERPASVETRQEVGHWEGDTVAGASTDKHCIVTLVERATGYTLIGKLHCRTTKALNRKVLELIRRSGLPFLSITYDNGTEFHGHAAMEEASGATIYFAHPHHPWERGTNENTNGLIRQYLPKGESMSGVAQRHCNAIAHRLNTRPRKRYGFRSPEQQLFG